MSKIMICLSAFFMCNGVSAIIFPLFIRDLEFALFLGRAASILTFIIATIFEFYILVPRESVLLDEIDDKNFSLDDVIRSKEFWKGYAAHIEKDTWGKGRPKVYMRKVNNVNEIVAHYKNGNIEILSSFESIEPGDLKLD